MVARSHLKWFSGVGLGALVRYRYFYHGIWRRIRLSVNYRAIQVGLSYLGDGIVSDFRRKFVPVKDSPFL